MGRSFNLRDPAEFRAFEAAGGHIDKCTNVVGVAAQIAARVLLSS